MQQTSRTKAQTERSKGCTYANSVCVRHLTSCGVVVTGSNVWATFSFLASQSVSAAAKISRNVISWFRAACFNTARSLGHMRKLYPRGPSPLLVAARCVAAFRSFVGAGLAVMLLRERGAFLAIEISLSDEAPECAGFEVCFFARFIFRDRAAIIEGVRERCPHRDRWRSDGETK